MGRNGSRPLDLDPRAGAKGATTGGAEVRRTAALGRGLTGVGVLDASGSIWLGTRTGSTSTPRRTQFGLRRGLERAGWNSRRRMANLRRRRAVPGRAERGRGRKQDREVLYHSAELQRRPNGEEEQRGGGSAELRASPTMAAAAARVLRGQGWRLRFDRVSRGSGVA